MTCPNLWRSTFTREKGITRVCNRCKRELPIQHFDKDRTRLLGRGYRCADCEVARMRKNER